MAKGGYRRKKGSWTYVYKNENPLRMRGTTYRCASDEKAEHLHDETTDNATDVGSAQRTMPGRRSLCRSTRMTILRTVTRS